MCLFDAPLPPLLPYTYTHTHPDDQIAKKKMGERNISNPVLSSPYKEIIFPVRTFFFFLNQNFSPCFPSFVRSLFSNPLNFSRHLAYCWNQKGGLKKREEEFCFHESKNLKKLKKNN
jgi:hypothetical protein